MTPRAIRQALCAHATLVALLYLLRVPIDSMAAATPNPTLSELQCEYGIMLAQNGDFALAESVFVSLLSHSSGDARALNNLGNLALLRGNPDAALSFYRKASESDTSDPGIRLNEATTLMLLGEEDAAVDTAGKGVIRAGGLERAADYLGLIYDGDVSGPRGDRKGLRREEALLLLRAAAKKVPADSTRSKPSSSDEKSAPSWRLASPRAGDENDLPAVVYWKR